MDFDAVLERFHDDLARVEEAMQESLASDVQLIPTIGRYLFSGGGKRLRPLLLLSSARLFGYEGPRAITLGCVVELIHTATLLHDDVVDEADQRRGAPTANDTWGNHASVLVGDFLFATSFSLMAADGDVRIMQTMAHAVTQLAEGEVLQLVSTGKLSEEEDEYLEVVDRKTAALISAACRIGAGLGDAPPAGQEALSLFGREIGIAFQLVDDALDYMAEEARLGKVVGKDLMEGHGTLPLIYLYRNATASERQMISDLLAAEEVTRQQVDQVVGMMKDYKAIDYTLQTASRYVAQAKQRLAVFDGSPDREVLTAIADYIVARDR
ncbi:MAG: polyprenyl synthetase family protein [bacterium]|nr:polyprenyl synthetase family protein [bacterium]